MGRYKDYDRGSKRGGYDDDQKSDDRASGVRPNYRRPSAPAERRPAPASQVVGLTSESIGTVKMYKADKGFGFVGQDDGGVWRSQRERCEHGIPAYVVLHDATLEGIASSRPKAQDQLRAVTGIGDKKLERYGDALLSIVRSEAS